jgi:hypothetical protein
METDVISHECGSRFFCRAPGGVMFELNTRADASPKYRDTFDRVRRCGMFRLRLCSARQPCASRALPHHCRFRHRHARLAQTTLFF